MRNINGFMYGNLPGLRMCKGDDVSWHFLGGPAGKMHSAYFYGNTLIRNGNNYDTVGLMEGIVFVLYLCIVLYFLHYFSYSLFKPNSLVSRQIYHRSTSFPMKYTIESMLHCLHYPNLINAAWLERICRGIGCVLAPTLFSLYFTAVLETTNEGLNRGVFIRIRTDCKLFNLAWLRAHTKTLKMCIRELLYADDSALVANNADPEVERRIQSATRAYDALQKRLWSCNGISTKTKVKVYSVAVIPCLLYSIECTTVYRRHIMALTSLQLRHLRCPTSSTSSSKTVSQTLRYCAVLTQSVLKP